MQEELYSIHYTSLYKVVDNSGQGVVFVQIGYVRSVVLLLLLLQQLQLFLVELLLRYRCLNTYC